MNSQRILAVLVAAVAGVLAWFLIEQVGGVDLGTPSMGGRPAMDITAVPVAFTSLVGSLLGWGILALVERRARNPRRTFVTIATVGAVLSLGAPFSGTGIGTNHRLLLALLHVVVAVVVIPLLARTARTARAES